MSILHFFVAIDPGASGGITTYMEGTREHPLIPVPRYLVSTPMIEDRKELYTWMGSYCGIRVNRTPGIDELITPQKTQFHYIVEKVSGFIGNEHPGSRMFEFGVNYGTLLTILDIHDIEYELVTPQVWQKELDIEPRRKGSNRFKEESNPEFKRRLKDKALELFTGYKEQVTLKTCDSMLIAYYGFLKWRKENQNVEVQ